ncbi:hypothetical protein FSP39_011075 [Pinctada imbricata]|uniref:Fibronectin type-III domain-containing protein n=1 Tax=Pinctada imbricata TaxID=66713 RepID=A0AA88Y3L4_PINIB|nr:hypothetical protein FSP39_011075 [Pinctada imbricata]
MYLNRVKSLPPQPPSPQPAPQCYQLPRPSPLPSVSFAVSTTGTAYIAVSWAVTGDTTYLLSFDVTYQKLGELNPTTQKFPVDKSKRDYRLDGLVHDTTYLVCLEALIQSSRPITSCVTQSTMKDTGVTMGPQTGDSNEVGIIVGVVVGGVVAIVIIVLVLIILLRNRDHMKKTPPPAQPVHFTRTPQDAPRVGYDSKRFSKPKKESANGHVNITVISDGKHNSRISAGSYQEVRNDSKVNNNLYPNTVNFPEGAHGSTPDWKMQNTKVPFSQNPHHMQPSAQSRYVNNPTKMNRAPAAPSYVNTDRQNAYNDHYANSMEARPLPKTPNNKPLSDKSSGFLNHGFTHSPTDSSSFCYTNEPQSGHDSVYNELDYDSGTVV